MTKLLHTHMKFKQREMSSSLKSYIILYPWIMFFSLIVEPLVFLQLEYKVNCLNVNKYCIILLLYVFTQIGPGLKLTIVTFTQPWRESFWILDLCEREIHYYLGVRYFHSLICLTCCLLCFTTDPLLWPALEEEM